MANCVITRKDCSHLCFAYVKKSDNSSVCTFQIATSFGFGKSATVIFSNQGSSTAAPSPNPYMIDTGRGIVSLVARSQKLYVETPKTSFALSPFMAQPTPDYGVNLQGIILEM